MEKVAEGLKIVGVSRGNEFSPNHVGNDAAIFQKVVDELVKMGCHVETFTETNFVEKQVKADVVFDMARNHATLEYLKSGVKNGKQFPFRYYSALKVIQSNKNIPFYALIVQTLEECIDLSVENMPKLKGKTICLSDNSGSAWGTFESEYGSVTVAEIDNLSSVITSINSDEGYVGKFGDKLNITAVIRKNGILSQAREISNDKGDSVGLSTENGIWLFFRDAITNKTHYDNIFIYSDMQAGHGGLYGKGNAYVIEGKNFILDGRYIDVLSLIKEYRNKVNPKVNVFCVQTAGYKNVLIPEYIYRGAILYGWTGKEAIFANELIRQWDELENKQ